MKLVKVTNSDKHAEDFGLSDGDRVYLYDNHMTCAWKGDSTSPIHATRLPTSPVVRVNALWVEKNIKIACGIADTQELKVQGLQGVDSLEENAGLFFPYVPYQDVSIHQGSVPFELDLIFIQDDMVCSIQENTKVGSTDVWSCVNCTGLIEVNGGFCRKNSIRVGDRVALFAVSERDIEEVSKERQANLSSPGKLKDRYAGVPAFVHLVSAIADSL